jgi:DNA-directed RNA polymerase specialized sigma subunit
MSASQVPSTCGLDDERACDGIFGLDESTVGPADDVERRDMVAALLASLGDREQTIYRWHFVDGLGFDVIAGRLGVTRTAVYAAWAAALDKMRRVASKAA